MRKAVSQKERAMRRFYLHKRAGIYYAMLIDQTTGKKLPARSTGKRDKAEVRGIVRDWLRDGVPIPSNRKQQPAGEFSTLASIISGIRSANLTPTDAEKLVHGQRMTGEHCQHSLSRARVHWFPAFDGKRLAELAMGDIRAFYHW